MRALLGVLLIFFCTLCLAAPRTYDIDVIIFSHITPQTLQSEQWPPLSSNTINQNAQTDNIKPTYQLQREKNVLQNTPGYAVLFSGSFRRSWNENGSNITIPINTNLLNGNIIVQLGHYFDVHTDLMLTEPTTILQKIDSQGYFTRWNQPTFDFHFLQNRRMRSRELNYLGSPLVGVLIKMNPVSDTNA